MVSRDVVEKQLKAVGCSYRFWGRAELAELQHILMDTETIALCVNGNYENGFALLCATDHRLLLIDKKPMKYLNVLDIRFEMITEFDYSHRMLSAAVRICTPTKALLFSSWNKGQLRQLLAYVQKRVIEIRQYYYLAQQFQAMAAQQQLQQAQPQPPVPTYVPNMAQSVREPEPTHLYNNTDTAQPAFASAASHLGVFTQSKLPHFRLRNSRSLGRYAIIPDEIYPPQYA